MLTLSYGPTGLQWFILPRIEGNYRFQTMTSLSVFAWFEGELKLGRETPLHDCCACVESSKIMTWSRQPPKEGRGCSPSTCCRWPRGLEGGLSTQVPAGGANRTQGWWQKPHTGKDWLMGYQGNKVFIFLICVIVEGDYGSLVKEHFCGVAM